VATFLRDQFIKNVTVNEDLLQQISTFLLELEAEINKTTEDKNNEIVSIVHIIRFDNRGYQLADFSDVKKFYAQASQVERLIFMLNSSGSKPKNNSNTSIELRFDANDPNNSYLKIESEDGHFVDSVFCRLIEIIKRFQNHNGKVRNNWTQLLVQLLGVGLGFVVSLIASLKLYPFVKIENAFVITFLFTFLIFSNTWGVINQQLLMLINKLFPNVRFARIGHSRWNWVLQGLIGGLIVTFAALIVTSIFSWASQILSNYVQW
jgi:hypothetical protein